MTVEVLDWRHVLILWVKGATANEQNVSQFTSLYSYDDDDDADDDDADDDEMIMMMTWLLSGRPSVVSRRAVLIVVAG